MDVRSEWMTVSPNESNIIKRAIKRFDTQRYKSLEGYVVTIDDKKETVVIQEHTNPLNQDKIDKKLFCELKSKVKRGSIVKLDNRTFLVVSRPESNLAYLKCKIVETNNQLKWKDNNNNIFTHQCIVSNVKQFNFLEENKYMTLPYGKLDITVQYNSETKNIQLDHRFILNSSVYKVVGIDDVTGVLNSEGILYLTIDKTTKLDADDFINQIADNSHLYSSNTDDGSMW